MVDGGPIPAGLRSAHGSHVRQTKFIVCVWGGGGGGSAGVSRGTSHFSPFND